MIVEKLPTHEAGQEKRVDSQRSHLHENNIMLTRSAIVRQKLVQSFLCVFHQDNLVSISLPQTMIFLPWLFISAHKLTTLIIHDSLLLPFSLFASMYTSSCTV